MNKRIVMRTVLYILVIIWMGVIFYLSSMSRDDSDVTSKGLLYKIVSISNVSEDKIDGIVEEYNVVIRKVAHVSEYLILSILVYLSLIYSDVSINKSIIISIIVCVLYSISDEVHQLFVNRGGQIIDVFIDSIGIFVGMFIVKIRLLLRDKC